MRTLLLLRHGKAVGSDAGGDHERPLAARGRTQAAAVATLMVRLGLTPDLALVSDSRRTQETAQLALQDSPTEVKIEAALYAAPAHTIIDLARQQSEADRRILIVGHNPGLGEAARLLEGTAEPQAAVALQQGFPTAALAVLEFDIARWSDLAPGSGLLARFVVPEA